MLCCWIFPGHSPASSQLREFLSCAVGLDNLSCGLRSGAATSLLVGNHASDSALLKVNTRRKAQSCFVPATSSGMQCRRRRAIAGDNGSQPHQEMCGRSRISDGRLSNDRRLALRATRGRLNSISR